ncbi:MAG: hypothetical protein HY909_26740 [Deltaproteobacteria bacterium]|nr:hypothetical protein [Deltaproteobacteria bacterium]
MPKTIHLTNASALIAVVLSCASSRPAVTPPAGQPPAEALRQPPQALRFIEGRWESSDPSNAWQMTARWSEQAGRFEAVLTRNGQRSEAVGFTVGELVWKATPQGEGAVREEQLFRSAGGAQTWREGSVNLQESTPDRLVTTYSRFVRVP